MPIIKKNKQDDQSLRYGKITAVLRPDGLELVDLDGNSAIWPPAELLDLLEGAVGLADPIGGDPVLPGLSVATREKAWLNDVELGILIGKAAKVGPLSEHTSRKLVKMHNADPDKTPIELRAAGRARYYPAACVAVLAQEYLDDPRSRFPKRGPSAGPANAQAAKPPKVAKAPAEPAPASDLKPIIHPSFSKEERATLTGSWESRGMKLVGLAVLLARSIPRKGKPNMTLSKGTVATWVLRGAESCGGFGPLAALRYDRDKILMPAEADICVALYKKLRAEADEVHRKSMRDRFKRSIEAAA